MNNCIFTTHHTLTKEHAKMSLWSLLLAQSDVDMVWDNFIIYNTQPDVISNDWLVTEIRLTDTNHMIKNLLVFPYEESNCSKTLTQDTINHFEILVENDMNLPGKTLLLKSDYCVSIKFNEIFKAMPLVNTIWSLPIYNAKEKLSTKNIPVRLNFETFVPVDDITYYRGGTNDPLTPGSLASPYQEVGPTHLPDGANETHPSIMYVSHNIQNDYNLHAFSNDILTTCLQICKDVYNVTSTYGGAHDLFNVAFSQAGIQKYSEITAFGVHMFHDIISPNRTTSRTDLRKLVEGERY